MRKIRNEELGRLTPDEFARAERMPVIVVLDNVRSMRTSGPFSGTATPSPIERSCCAASPPCPPRAKSIRRRSAPSLPWTGATAPRPRSAWRSCGPKVVRFTPSSRSRAPCPLDRFVPEPGRRYALVFGNEVDGVSQQVADRSDGALEIPQAGTKHSLNVAVSGGVVLWNFFCRIRPKR